MQKFSLLKAQEMLINEHFPTTRTFRMRGLLTIQTLLSLKSMINYSQQQKRKMWQHLVLKPQMSTKMIQQSLISSPVKRFYFIMTFSKRKIFGLDLEMILLFWEIVPFKIASQLPTNPFWVGKWITSSDRKKCCIRL